jgi:hypothetical protein
MAKRPKYPIKISPFDDAANRRAKGANRRAIAAATPAEREKMQLSHSLVGNNRKDITFILPEGPDGFL